MQIERVVDSADSWSLSAGGARFAYRRLGPGALLVTISGNDQGQFGTAALDEIRLEIMRQGRIELLVDAEQATNVAPDVSQQWTAFFSTSREQLRRVSVLTGTKIVSLTVAIAQHLSRTGNLIQIYSDRELFDAAVKRSVS